MNELQTIAQPIEQIELFGPNGYAIIGKTSLDIEGADFETWQRIAQAVNEFNLSVDQVTKRDLPWLIGDAYHYGEDNFGEDEVANTFDPVKFNPKTVLNRVKVCRAIPASRRRENLTFSHHAAVYALELNQQEELLDLAIADQLSVSELSKVAKERYPSEKSKKAKEKRELKALAQQTDNPSTGEEEATLDEPTAVYYARKFTEYLELQQEEFKDYSTDRIEQYEALFAAIKRMERKMKNAKKEETPNF